MMSMSWSVSGQGAGDVTESGRLPLPLCFRFLLRSLRTAGKTERERTPYNGRLELAADWGGHGPRFSQINLKSLK